MPESIVFMVIAIVLISTAGSIFKTKYTSKGEADDAGLAQIQADLNELKKSVEDIKEYITDLYIQQHDDKLR